MKSEKVRLYTIEITLIIFFLLAMIFNNVITRPVIAIVLLVFMVISKLLIKSEKQTLTTSTQITVLLIGIGLIYVILLYMLGIFTGFYTSTVQLSIWSIWNYIIPYIVIIISAENIRKTLLLKEGKYSKAIVLVMMVLLDVIINTNIYSLNTVNDYFVLVSFIIFASIANNLLFNYIILKHRNAEAIIMYRLITTLYSYILPVSPDIYIFLECIIKMIAPYLVYMILERIYGSKKVTISVTQRKKDRVITIVYYIIIVIIAILVSCKFKYGIMIVGSGSMTGTLNKGDIIFYEKYGKNDEIEDGQIIVFNKDGMKIIHRIIEQKLMGTEIRYYTKGDANQDKDDGYRERKDIIGQVKARIPYVGYLTLWVNDFIGGSK